MPLTDVAIRRIKPKAKPYKLYDGGGLFLWVQPKGGKWWRYEYRFLGKRKLLALGTYPEVSLADARESHKAARQSLAANIDPNQAKKETRLNLLINAENIPVGKSTWWDGIQKGRFPKAIKLSERCTAWRAEDIHALIKALAE